jgi:hypothetical protein
MLFATQTSAKTSQNKKENNMKEVISPEMQTDK